MLKLLKKNQYFWLLIAVSAVVFLANLGVLYPNIMETRNFVAAREMLTEGNWLLPTLNDLPRYQKPPLPTWLTAFTAKIFNSHELWVMRLPAAFAAISLSLFFYKFQRKFSLSASQAFRHSLILITSFYIVFSGRDGQWDIFTHACMFAAIYFLFYLFQDRKQNIWKSVISGGVFCGLSVLSKGPVSLYALFLPFLIAYFGVYGLKSLKANYKYLIVFLVLGLTLGGWWFIYVRLADPAAFLEIAKKETSNWTSYNVRPFYYYWSFFVQSGIWTIPAFVSLWYPYLKNRVNNKKAYTFSLLWTLSAVLLLSIIPEKKSRYLLPVLIPLAMNTGFYIEYVIREFKNFKIGERTVLYFNHGLIALVGLAFPFAGYFFLNLDGFEGRFAISSIVLLGIGVGIVYFLFRNSYRLVFYLSAGLIVAILLFAYPLMYSFLDNPRYQSTEILKNYLKTEEISLIEYQDFTPEIIWDYGEAIPLTKDLDELKEQDEFGLMCRLSDTLEVQEKFGNYELKKKLRIDLNQVAPDKNGYKNRLLRIFYHFKKN